MISLVENGMCTGTGLQCRSGLVRWLCGAGEHRNRIKLRLIKNLIKNYIVYDFILIYSGASILLGWLLFNLFCLTGHRRRYRGGRAYIVKLDFIVVAQKLIRTRGEASLPWRIVFALIQH